ncbi:transcription elongation factor GreAB [Mycolicibacterium novocastrense]|uniref:GreA/GreB family elongation factor n=1 Tax=Mycolicibacterium novocastrense TaxID=59813 RepID=UPI00074ACAAF|nr:GreA/GreB family elongation factor [Mycolicibacterium novocastrense]KUH68270.1 transcription elongation factor GreAB [Mycolicibacterium novocastrense]KUH68892.1 transcription elongation factor GreAB [Mycolicibacterium novocastrense]KUH76444.1 transcription elongation factor GreAB [Mycolicibacterium novocastrense]
MASADRVWMTRRAYIRLQAELAELSARPRSGGPDPTRTAEDRMRSNRIHRIEHLLANAVVGEDPPDDGVAEPGMVLTIRYDDTGDTETFLLGIRGIEPAEIEVYSPRSPLGVAILGARPGDRRTYLAPTGKELHVTLLQAKPYGAAIDSATSRLPA